MRGVHSDIDDPRRSVFREVAALAYEGGNYARVDQLPHKLVPKGSVPMRYDIFLDRAVVAARVKLALGMDLPDKIASYIAENVTANVRQLEGTVNKIKAYKDLLGSTADEETVNRAIQDMLKRSNEYIPSPSAIIDYICKYYNLEEAVLRGQQRNRDAVLARQIAMYLIRSMTNLSLDDIGREFGNRDHSTVIHSLDKVEEQMKKSPTFAETVKEIKTNINSRR